MFATLLASFCKKQAITCWFFTLLLFPVFAHAAGAEPSVKVKVALLSRHTLKETVTAFGDIKPDPDQLTSITLPRAGLVSHLDVRLGQRVEAGQALLELDTAPNARMEFLQAEAAVDFAKKELDRLRTLFKEQLATRDQVATAERNLRDAQSRLQAQRKLGTDRPTEVVRAPFAGIVTQLSVQQGERVQADTTALLLASGEALVVELGLEQEDARRIKAGQAVVLTSLFHPDLQVATVVGEVHAMVNPKTRLVDVLVRIPKSETTGFVLGEAMQGLVTLREVQALAVPRSAVLRDEQGSYLFVVEKGRAQRINVTTGLQEAGMIAISGKELQEGQKVVTVGNYELQDGMAVREATP
jgi:membrane fusion protein (multidrug efflux system)